MKKSVVTTLVAIVTVLSVGVGATASAMDKAVTLLVDGQPQQVHVWGRTVQDVLDSNDLVLSGRDELSPAASEPIRDGSVIEVRYARPLTVIVDGAVKTVWTTATTLNDALTEIGLHDPMARLSVSRSTPLGRDGLIFAASTPKEVQLTVAGATRPVRSTAADVAGLLADQEVVLGEHDRVSVPLDTRVSAGLTVAVQRVEVRQETEEQSIDFQTVTSDDATLARGVERVTQEGQPGAKTVIWQVVYVDGAEESRSALSENVAVEPVAKLVTVGTASAVSTGTAGSPASYSGSHSDWMAAAGISPADFSAVEILVMRESSWNPNAINPTSGACGLVQALPCSKLGSNWNDPVTALIWGQQYVNERYGGWQAALAHSYAVGWY